MLNLERRNKILELVEERGKVEVAELSRRFEISDATIRNDLKELDRRGLVHRAHGGAIRVDTAAADPSLQVKAGIRAEQKRRIGAAAAALVEDGDSIILDSGTTTQQIARHLKGKRNLKVITNALKVAAELASAASVQLILLGGLVRPNSLSVVGHFAQDMLAQLAADKLFLAVDAFDLELGLSTPNLEESQVNQAMARVAKRTILVADSSKFGKQSLSRIVPLSAVHTIVTDDELPADARAALDARGIEVILA
jgi:DeoR family transcriptional regulator of aga operon